MAAAANRSAGLEAGRFSERFPGRTEILRKRNKRPASWGEGDGFSFAVEELVASRRLET